MSPRENPTPPDPSDRDDPPNTIERNEPDKNADPRDPDGSILDLPNPEAGPSEISEPDNPDTRSPY